MQSPQAKLKEITRLLALWPSANGSGEDQLRGYLLAVDDYPADDVHAAVETLMKGIAPGVNPNFLPPPPVVGSECRRQMNLRLDREARDKRYTPALPKPDIERSPESQERVRALMERAVRGLTKDSEGDSAEARHRRQMQRTNEYFDVERGFSIGDMDAQEDAA